MFGPIDELLGIEGLGEFARGTIFRCRSPTGNPLDCLCREGDLSPLCCRATLLKVITQSTSSPANTVDWVKWTDTRILLGRFPDMVGVTVAVIEAFDYHRFRRLSRRYLARCFRILEQQLDRSGGLGATCAVVEGS